MTTRTTKVLIIALAVGLMAAACGDDETADTTTLDDILERGYVRIGFTNAAPFGYGGAPGELLGLDPDVEREIWNSVDIEVVGILAPFGSLIPGVNANRIDITASMFVTPERCQQVGFSNPHYGIGQAMAVKTGNPLSIHSYDDVAASLDAVLGVVAGGVENDYAAAAGIPAGRLQVFPDAASALAGLQADRVDAIALTSGGIRALLEGADDPSIERALPFDGPKDEEGREIKGYSSFAFRPGDTELIDLVNEAIEAMRADGRLLQILLAHGFSEAEFVESGEVTIDELCTE